MSRFQAPAFLLGIAGVFAVQTATAQVQAPAVVPSRVAPSQPANRVAAPPAARPVAAPGNPTSPPQQGGAPSIAPPRVTPEAVARMEQLLQEWEARSAQDESLYAEFTRTDKDVEMPRPRVFDGKALLKRPNQACLEFKERLADQKEPVFYERIVADGAAVYHFQAATKQVFVYKLDEDARRRALEEGPLPFMFNMKRDEAKRRFEMYLIQEMPAKDGKPPMCLIEIRPRLNIDQAEFVQAFVMLNIQTFLPEALQLVAPNQQDKKTFVFRSIQRNGNTPAVNPANYDARNMVAAFQQKAGYKVVVDPGPNAPQAPAAVGSGQPGGRPAQPAMGPGQAIPRRR